MNYPNSIFDILIKRVSHRKFKDKPLSNNDINKLIKAAKSSPTSSDGHTFSIIKVTNKELLKAVAKWVNQDYIAKAGLLLLFVTDFTRVRIKDKENEIYDAERLLQPFLSSFLNIGLSMMATIIQAESMNIGATCIGGIRWGKLDEKGRNSFNDLKKLFHLPKKTFISCGLILGYKILTLPIKPKLPNEADVFENYYIEGTFTNELRIKHSKELENYYVNLLKLPTLAKKSWEETQRSFLISKLNDKLKVNVDKAMIDFLHHQKILLAYKINDK